MIAYILWGERLDGFKQEINRTGERFTAGFGRGNNERSDNLAFEQWRQAEIDRLKQERRKLDQMRDEFDAHLRELRMDKDKDKEEFDAFMASRKGSKKTKSAKTGRSVPKV